MAQYTEIETIGEVESVNGETGEVVLTADNVIDMDEVEFY